MACAEDKKNLKSSRSLIKLILHMMAAVIISTLSELCTDTYFLECCNYKPKKSLA
jgi:hypothetical protein